jgi:hypothetical protein
MLEGALRLESLDELVIHTLLWLGGSEQQLFFYEPF